MNMKTSSFPAMVIALALMAIDATASPLPSAFHGPLTITWSLSQQKLDDAPQYSGSGKTNITGTGSAKTTNVVQVYHYSVATSPFVTADFLKLLANSLNATFPGGSKLI